MMKIAERNLISQYLATGGKVTVVSPSRRRVRTFRGPAGVAAKGAKSVRLKNSGIYLR